MTGTRVTEKGPLMLFDGVCNLCTGSVRFVIARDPAARIRFASMQSPAGQAILRDLGLPTDRFESFLFIDGGTVHDKSCAALRVARYLPQPWKALAVLARVVPRPLADLAYRLVARNRYRLFGRRDTCMLPEPDVKARFLE